MITDIVNFTDRSSSQSRHELLELLELHDSLLRPIFESFEGEIIKTMGDAFLVTFESPTDAVLCGMDIQKKLKIHNITADGDKQIEIRIAINAGEVTIKNGDIFGETVNITARIENITEPNEIYFTDAVYLSMNKSEIPSSEIGMRYLKGIPREIKVYKVLHEVARKVSLNPKHRQPSYIVPAGGRGKTPMVAISMAAIVAVTGIVAFKYGQWFDGIGRQGSSAKDAVMIDPQETSLASANRKYSELVQQFNCPADQAGYGEYTDYGYWEGGFHCGQEGKPGYWVWVKPTWFVWEQKRNQAEIQQEESPSTEESGGKAGKAIENSDPQVHEDRTVLLRPPQAGRPL